MTILCGSCTKPFNTNWQLQRHLSRKYPCRRVTSNESKTQVEEVTEPDDEPTESVGEMMCKYCGKEFSRADYLKQHMKKCKEKDDVVRYCEMKLNIKMIPHSVKTGCRFCMKVLFDRSGLCKHLRTCKAKEKYKEELKERFEQIACSH